MNRRHRTGLVLISLFILLAWDIPTRAADPDWPFPDELRSSLAYLHPLTNYAIHPAWQRQWEKHLVTSNGLQASVGSVTSDELYTDVTLNLSEPLNRHFRFLYHLVWRQGQHLDLTRQQHWLGFELGLTAGLGLQLQVHPAPSKEELDLLTGLLWTDGTRERYLRISLRLDDFVYEAKNDQGGISDQERVAVQWALRYQLSSWEFFSTGDYGSPSRRSYPDAEVSPVIAAQERRQGAATARLRYLLTDDSFVAVAASHYHFAAIEGRRGTTDGFDYANEFVHLAATGYLTVADAWWIRPECNWVQQWASADGRRHFSHQRDDLFPALYLEWRSSKRARWELGYMAVHHRWDFVVPGVISDQSQGTTDKLKLGWTHEFKPTARLHLSLSHEPSLSRFGGGNVQWQLLF